MSYGFYYWPHIQGRGEFVRLALEATRTTYRDVCREDGVAAMERVMDETGRPPFACPFLVDGDIVVAQVAAILQHIGPAIGLAPKAVADRLWLHQVQLTLADLVKDVHDAHHPLGAGLYYEEQTAEARRATVAFLDRRLPKYMDWLEAVLARNPSGPAYLVGERVSYADLSVFQVVEGLTYAFPRAWRRSRHLYPGVLALHHRCADLPALAAYLTSPRRLPFNESGIFRHYPALDV